mmetsp:Transcript_19807/g.55059  ORF Transcript_19807/g.55059 Transcript_19807/m.55059 type:complete len:212 (-) Transcript_19807:525-1160(-)
MSPAGTSVSAPMCLLSSVMKDWQKRITSPSERPLGSKSEPPLPPPRGRVVSEFLRICSNPRNLMTERFTEGWNLRPPLYGPRVEENCTRKPRLTCVAPSSSTHGTRKTIIRSGSAMRSKTAMNSGRLAKTGAMVSITSFTACRNSGSCSLRRRMRSHAPCSSVCHGSSAKDCASSSTVGAWIMLSATVLDTPVSCDPATAMALTVPSEAEL